MTRQLGESITEHAILNTNFFNGRLLTAEDLKADQKANREQHRQLGYAIGEGVICGLEVRLVSPGSAGELPVVSVSKGLALNRTGYVLMLPDDEQVTLVETTDLPAPEAGLFADCGAATSTVTSLANGVYTLVIGPVSEFKEHAPVQALSIADTLAGCGNRYAAEGVKFRLAKVDLDSFTGIGSDTRTVLNNLITAADTFSLSTLRNLLAHIFFGTEELSTIARDPFKQTGNATMFASYGVVDFMRSRGDITNCEAPLALIYWTGGQVRFLDMWATRRLPARSVSNPLSHLFAPRRLAEAEARFFQFQEHLASFISKQPNPGNLIASDTFRYLPPAGLVPLRTGAFPIGVSTSKFFQNRAFGPPTPISGDRLRSLFHESLFHDPIDLNKQELVQLYTVIDNVSAQPYAVFASAQLPYVSTSPRFPDLCRTLRECREAFSDLNKKNVLFNDVSQTELMAKRLSVFAAIQDVSSIADGRYLAACRSGNAPDLEGALAMLKELYEAEKSLVEELKEGLSFSGDSGFSAGAGGFGGFGGGINFSGFFSGLSQSFTSIVELMKLLSFANLLETYLDVGIPGNKPSLKSALDQKNLKAAIEAQDAINGLAASWSGEATTGTIEVRYQSSNRGKTLVVSSQPGGANPFEYTFRITNKTNRKLDIQLSAEFLSPRESWNSAISILDTDGANIQTVSLDSFNPNNPNAPGAFTDVVVSIVTPVEAQAGQTGNLSVRAFVPPPAGVAGTDQLALSAGNEEVSEAPTSVSFTPQSPVLTSGSMNQASVGSPTSLRFDSLFHTTQAPTSRQFTFRVSVTSPGTAGSLYNIQFTDKNQGTPPAPPAGVILQRVTQPFMMQNDVQDSTTVRIVPLSGSIGSANALIFSVTLQAVDDASVTASKGPFTITVTS